MLQRYFGDKEFNARVARIVVPIIIQNGITNFVSLLDNIMVGQVGTLPMSGVSIVNQLMFIFYLCTFGASSGAGIFTAQFYGSQDHKGVRNTFRFKIVICSTIALLGLVLFTAASTPLINLYLTGDGNQADAAAALSYGSDYLRVMLWGLIPFGITASYASTLRETGETFVPMVGSITAVFVNLILNYVLIFGHFGAPEMGVEGAALATVISRFVEFGIVAGWTHLHTEKNAFIVGAYRTLMIPRDLLKKITIKGMPLLLNEFLWSSGVSIMVQCYSTCGLDVVPAINIANTLSNLSSVVYMSMGNAVGIIMGQMLGANLPRQEIKDSSRKLIVISVSAGILFGLLMASFSGVFPRIYNTSASVRILATQMICVAALMMPLHSFGNAAYFTLRSGGKTMITFLFDSGFIWCVCVPIGFLLSRFTAITIIPLYFICQAVEVLKLFLGGYFLKKGTWIQNLT